MFNIHSKTSLSLINACDKLFYLGTQEIRNLNNQMYSTIHYKAGFVIQFGHDYSLH